MNRDKAAVAELQRYLREIGITADGYPLIPDGRFGKETEEAVRAFEASVGLEQTGRVDYERWTLIYKSYRRKKAESAEVYGTVAPSELPLEQGSRSGAVYELSLMLNRLSLLHGDFEPVELTDTFTEEHRAAVMHWQKITATEQTGRVDIPLWNGLYSYLRLRSK